MSEQQTTDSIYQFAADDIKGQPTMMSEFKNKVCLFKRAKKPQNRGQRRRAETSSDEKSSDSNSDNEE
jgi:hypothetical protein